MIRRLCRLILPVAAGFLTGCASDRFNDTTVVGLVGVPGSGFSGYYVQSGRRVDLSGTMPFTAAYSELSEFVIRKVQPEETVVMAAQNDLGVWRSEVASTAGVGIAGLRLRVHEGLEVEKIRLGE
jgi:hypothetical protein